MPLKYLDSHSQGEVVSRIISDVEQFADGLLMGFTQFFTGIMTILGTLVFMISIHKGITVLVVLVTPLSLFDILIISYHLGVVKCFFALYALGVKCFPHFLVFCHTVGKNSGFNFYIFKPCMAFNKIGVLCDIAVNSFRFYLRSRCLVCGYKTILKAKPLVCRSFCNYILNHLHRIPNNSAIR